MSLLESADAGEQLPDRAGRHLCRGPLAAPEGKERVGRVADGIPAKHAPARPGGIDPDHAPWLTVRQLRDREVVQQLTEVPDVLVLWRGIVLPSVDVDDDGEILCLALPLQELEQPDELLIADQVAVIIELDKAQEVLKTGRRPSALFHFGNDALDRMLAAGLWLAVLALALIDQPTVSFLRGAAG